MLATEAGGPLAKEIVAMCGKGRETVLHVEIDMVGREGEIRK